MCLRLLKRDKFVVTGSLWMPKLFVSKTNEIQVYRGPGKNTHGLTRSMSPYAFSCSKLFCFIFPPLARKLLLVVATVLLPSNGYFEPRGLAQLVTLLRCIGRCPVPIPLRTQIMLIDIYGSFLQLLQAKSRIPLSRS
jgi:hypothetical protein